MQRSQRCLISAIAVLALLTPAAAFGQVTFDNGPSSKEYAIPLDAARGATKTKAPKPKAQAPVTATAPAVPAAPTTTTPSKPRTAKKQDASTKRSDAVPAVTPTEPPSADPQVAVKPATASSDSGPGAGVIIGGLALAALVLGGLAGLVLRRRRRPDAQPYAGS